LRNVKIEVAGAEKSLVLQLESSSPSMGAVEGSSAEVPADVHLEKMLARLDARTDKKKEEQKKERLKNKSEKKGDKKEENPAEKPDGEQEEKNKKKRGRPPSRPPATPVKEPLVAEKSSQKVVEMSSKKESQKRFTITDESTRCCYRCRNADGKSVSFNYGDRGSNHLCVYTCVYINACI